MQPSIFNVRVPLRDQSDVFLMNTLTDAQIIVPPEVVSLLDSVEGRTKAGAATTTFDAEEREALATLTELGFLVESREADRRALDAYFDTIRHDTSQLRLTVLTTLQCNFACGYCFQGDHDDHNRHAHKMSLETAQAVVEHAARQMDTIHPERVSMTFFGGEPLLNLPVVYYLAEHVHAAATARGIRLTLSLITNGLLLTPAVVDRLLPYGLTGAKVTLDGDQAAHDLKRPLRGGQGTFDKIVANVRAVAGKVKISIGGNFDAENAGSYPALLDFLAQQEFAAQIAKVSFKPVMGGAAPSTPGASASVAAVPAGRPSRINGIIPLTAKFMQAASAAADRVGAVLICDEIQCGLGRTGAMFAFQHAGIVPDIVTLAKPLGGGLPLGAVIIGPRLESVVKPGHHGTTFGGNPLACKLGLAVIYELERARLVPKIAAIGKLSRRCTAVLN